MNTQTIDRQATTRGLSGAVGTGGKVNNDVGECGYCQEFAGEAALRKVHGLPKKLDRMCASYRPVSAR
jgi:hypothetical protein